MPTTEQMLAAVTAERDAARRCLADAVMWAERILEDHPELAEQAARVDWMCGSAASAARKES